MQLQSIRGETRSTLEIRTSSNSVLTFVRLLNLVWFESRSFMINWPTQTWTQIRQNETRGKGRDADGRRTHAGHPAHGSRLYTVE